MISDANKELLTDEGMAEARNAIALKRNWFVHVTAFDKLTEIAQHGLAPRNPGVAIGSPVHVDPDIAAAIGADDGKILCLMPLHSHSTRPQRSVPQVALAVSAADLPKRIGVDWSYADCIDLIDILVRQNPKRPLADIFVEVAIRRGSLVSYDAIVPSALRVWALNTPFDDPSQWPLLSKTVISNVAVLP